MKKHILGVLTPLDNTEVFPKKVRSRRFVHTKSTKIEKTKHNMFKDLPHGPRKHTKIHNPLNTSLNTR